MTENQHTGNPSARQALLDLAERCEREEPSAGLDDAIFMAVGCMIGDQAVFSISLNAALTLVPPQCAWEVSWTISYVARAVVYGQDIHVDCEGETPALAVCAAALRARAGETE